MPPPVTVTKGRWYMKVSVVRLKGNGHQCGIQKSRLHKALSPPTASKHKDSGFPYLEMKYPGIARTKSLVLGNHPGQCFLIEG